MPHQEAGVSDALGYRAKALAKLGITEANITTIKTTYGVTETDFDLEKGTVHIYGDDIPLNSLV